MEFCPFLSLLTFLLYQLFYAAQNLLGLKNYLSVPLTRP